MIAPPVLTLLASTVLFLLLHLWVERWSVRSGIPFHQALRLSRGIVSVLLVGIGVSTLTAYFALWPQAFLLGHEPVGYPWHLVMVICGHFVSDLLWLAWGRVARESKPRRDLILHHVVGLGACGAALYWQLGYLLLGIAMTTELMPVATGLGAWGKVRDSLSVERFAVGFSIAALVLWRLPFWIYILWIFGSGSVTAELPSLPSPVPTVAWLLAASVVAMDLYWTRQLWGSYRELRTAHRLSR